MAMALSCSPAVVTVSPSSSFLGSPVFLPSLSSSLLVTKNGVRSRKWSSRVSYGIPGYGAPRPCQTPAVRPSETIANPTGRSNRQPDFQWHFGAPEICQTPRCHLAPRAYGPGTTTEEGITLEDVEGPEFDGGGVNGGGSRGDDNGGSGGGGSGDGSGEGEGDGAKKKKPGLSMSQKLTLAYAILVGVGGIMGFAKSGSSKSLMAGGGSASILYYVFLNLPSNPVLASTIGLGISGLLLFIMGSRYLESGKVFPAGVVSLFSLVMAGGYIHGIMRSAHT